MRTFVMAALVGLLALPGFAPAPPDARDLNVQVFNESGYTIYSIYSQWCTRPSRDTSDLLRENVLYPAQNVYIGLQPGCVNLRAVTEEGYEFHTNIIVDADGVYEWYIYSN